MNGDKTWWFDGLSDIGNHAFIEWVPPMIWVCDQWFLHLYLQLFLIVFKLF